MSSEDIGAARTARGRRRWLIALCLYGALAAVDVAAHLREDLRIGNKAIDYGDVAVAVAAGLFWPADLVAHALLH